MNDLFRVRLDFPDNPALDDEFLAQNGATYRWDGTVWMPIGSGAGVYLPLAGGTMEGTLVLDANPVNAMEAATKVYVDSIATGARMIIGIIDATNGRCIYSGATGLPPGPLVDASTVQSGSDVICVVAGTIPPDPLLPVEVWNMTLAVSDVLVSNGANWILVHVPRAPITAGQVLTIPAVFGSNNVQEALTQAEAQDMPPGGAIGQILAKRVGADYDTEWVDAAAIQPPLNTDLVFMNRTPGGSGAADPNGFGIGSQSIWMNSNPVNMPPMSAGNTAQGFWQINTYRAGSTKVQDAIEHTNPSPGPSTILSRWVRPGGNLDTTWGPWVQQSISSTDGAFVRLTGDTMTGPLAVSFGNAGETTSGGQIALFGAPTSFLNLQSQSGGSFRYVNRGNNQGGLTFVTNGAPTYVDWLIFNAASNALSINNLNGNGITIINGEVTVTGDLTATGGSFAGRVTAALAPTQNAHLANKGYVDQLFSAAPILIGVIDAGTANCSFADGSVGPLPVATASRHYIICTRPGTIPSGPAAGIVMRIGDEIIDVDVGGTPTWVLIAVGMGGVLTTADQVALVPNVAGTNNVQSGLQVLNTNKVEKTGDTLTGTLRWPTTVASNPPNATGTSTGERLRIYDAAGAPGMGIGVEASNMWFNNAAANNGYRFYLGASLAYTMNSAGFQLKQAGVGGVSLHNGSASQCGYTEYFTQEGTRRGYTGYKGAGNTLIMKAEQGWNWEITEALPYLNTSGEITVTMGPNVNGGVRLRKNNNTGNPSTSTPRVRFEAADGRMMGALYGIQNPGNGYYGTWPSQMRCTVGHGGFGEQTCWTSFNQAGGWTGLRVEGDLNARSYSNYSDVSLKSDIVPLDPAVAQKAFESLSPVQFHWKPKKVEDPLAAPHGWRHGPDEDPHSRHWGFLAQDIEKGAPHLVQGSVGSKSYDLAGVIAVLTAKLKAMEEEIEHLKAPRGLTHKAKH